MSDLVIMGKSPQHKDWGVVDALVEENGVARERNSLDHVLDAGYSKMLDWQRASDDYKGAFHRWQFKLAVTEVNR